MEAHPDMKAKIVLDNDVGGDILKIVSKCKIRFCQNRIGR